MRNTGIHRLPCGFTENDLIAEALGETAPELSRQVRAHLAACRSCVALLEQYRRLRAQLHSLSISDSSDQGLQEARRALDARLAGQVRPRLLLDVWHSPVGDIRIGKAKLEWCKGRTHAGNGVKKSWRELIAWFES